MVLWWCCSDESDVESDVFVVLKVVLWCLSGVVVFKWCCSGVVVLKVVF